MKALLLLIALLTLSACASVNSSPATPPSRVENTFAASQAEIFDAVRRVLLLEGYQITNSSEEGGTISTAPRTFDVKPEHADCGKRFGIDYLKDSSTATEVAINAVVGDGSVTLRANIQGVYTDYSLDCVSKGLIERSLMTQVEAELTE